MRETARLASLGLAHAGDWLNLVPCPALGLHLSPAEFTAALKYRLGASLTGRDLALPVVAPRTPLVTTLCAVVALEKELLATTVCGTPFTRLRSKLLLAQLERGGP